MQRFKIPAQFQSKVLLNSEDIEKIVNHIAQEINKYYSNYECINVWVVMKGAFVFAADLIRGIDKELAIEFIDIKSYNKNRRSLLQLNKLPESPLNDNPILIVEDIVDSGHTLSYLLEIMQEWDHTIDVATLFFKPHAFQYKYPIRFIGKHIGNEFIVGYGLDYDQKGRNLDQVIQLVPDKS